MSSNPQRSFRKSVFDTNLAPVFPGNYLEIIVSENLNFLINKRPHGVREVENFLRLIALL